MQDVGADNLGHDREADFLCNLHGLRRGLCDLFLRHRDAVGLEQFLRRDFVEGGEVTEGIFEGETINTPSMLATEDYLDALNWVEGLGGVEAAFKRSDANLAVLDAWVAKTPWVEFLAADKATRSNTSVTLSITDPRVAKLDDKGQQDFVKKFVALLEKENAAYDIGGYKAAPPGLRIWCGATVEAADLDKLTPWLDWAFEETVATLG